jgi:hypothetical protein
MGKKGQTYQNKFKFKPNLKSKTEGELAKIANIPLDKMCQRCYDVVQWKVDFQKYKALKAARKCEKCRVPRVVKAYRIICDGCALAKKAEGILLCTKCGVNVKTLVNAAGNKHYAVPKLSSKLEDELHEKKIEDVEVALSELKPRDRKRVERRIGAGEIKYSHKL